MGEEKAVKVIKDFSERKKCYIGVSWGKDSVVIADLAYRNNINLSIIHLYCVPSHNKECDKVRNEFLKIYSHANYNEIIVNYGNLYSMNLPDDIQDKETDKLWRQGFKKAEIKYGENHISGVRGEESGKRTIRMKVHGVESKNTLAPIGYWKNEDVFAYLYKYNLPVHPNYAMLGNGRYKRENIRVAEIGDVSGANLHRRQWEKEYYRNELRRLQRRN